MERFGVVLVLLCISNLVIGNNLTLGNLSLLVGPDSWKVDSLLLDGSTDLPFITTTDNLQYWNESLESTEYDIYMKNDARPNVVKTSATSRPGWVAIQSFLVNQIAPAFDNVTINCRNDALLYLEHLSNFTLWAVQMYDSTVKIPSGILSGDNNQLGHFDQCLGVTGPPVRAQYCLADVQIAPQPEVYPSFNRAPEDYIDPFSLKYDMMASAWEKMILPIDPSKRRRDKFRWAICIPASCTKEDVAVAFGKGLNLLEDSLGVKMSVTISDKACTAGHEDPWTTGEIVMGTILLISVITMILTTAYDMLIYQKRRNHDLNTKQWEQTALSFSAYSNLVRLFKPDSSTEMANLHGMRVYSLVLTILGHRCMFSYGGPFHNPEFLEERYRKFQDMFLLNGSLIVDTFFLLSGFLTCYGLLQELAKRRRINLPTIFAYRWMRITPVYMMIVGFYATLLLRLGSGPIWNEKIGREVERCRQNWWTNLLYINNYVNVEGMCMFQSWYVSCDMHFFLMGTVLVILATKYKRLLKPLLGSLLVLSIAIPFIVTLVGKYDAILRVYMSILVDPPANKLFNSIYITSHNRAGPYVVGLIAAYIYVDLKKRDVVFSQRVMWIGSTLAAIAALGSQFGAWSFYIPGRPYYALENAFYAGFHRITWSIGMAFVMIAGGITTYGQLNPILGLGALTPLSRLTYSAFLCHGIVQLYTVSSVRMPIYMSFPRLFWMTTGDIIMSFGLALVVYLLFEAPIKELQRMMLKRPNKRKIEGKPTQPSIEIGKLESIDMNQNNAGKTAGGINNPITINDE